MHNSVAISILNCALDNPCFFTQRVRKILIPKSSFTKISFIGCVSKHVLFLGLLFLSSAPPQTMGKILVMSVARRKCLCVSGKVILWPTHFDIKMLVPMFYLKRCNPIYIYAYMYIYGYIISLLRNLLPFLENMIFQES